MPKGKNIINNVMKTMKQNSPLRDVCPDKKLTYYSARKTAVKKLRSSGIPKCEIKIEHHWPQLRARFRRLWLQWWKRAKNYVPHHQQCHKCNTSIPTYLLSANYSQSSLQFQPLQCNAQQRWKPFFTIKFHSEQVRWRENLFSRFWHWLAEFCSGSGPYFCWKQLFPNWTF